MILDTNVVSALSFRDADLRAFLSSSHPHHLPVIVLGEYRSGIIGSLQRPELTHWFDALVGENVVLDITAETTRIYASISNDLKTRGQPIPTNDIWIAALAQQHGLPVVSRDAHFDRVPGLQRITW